ncbi:hypothetical protein SAMN03159448_04816 [Sinorhizobium sp. NFACC03]|nr:hypothetical protein SAMN03159448_04816 [Sinorhizobium sp. NFACC03]
MIEGWFFSRRETHPDWATSAVEGGSRSTAMSSWNSGRITGHKPPLKPKEVCAIRIRLQMSGAIRDLALFNLAIAQVGANEF